MSPLDIFAWIVLLVIVLSALAVIVVAGGFPGKIAAQRGHPQADAIRVAGWLGLLTFGVVWVIALIWAFMRPVAGAPAQAAEIAALTARLEALEARRAEGGATS